MLENGINRHDGCPNSHHCPKDEIKCCYLVKGNCIIGEKVESRQSKVAIYSKI